MRSFIGLDLSATEKLALDSWRQQALPEVSDKTRVKKLKRNIKSRTLTKRRDDLLVSNEMCSMV